MTDETDPEFLDYVGRRLREMAGHAGAIHDRLEHLSEEHGAKKIPI